MEEKFRYPSDRFRRDPDMRDAVLLEMANGDEFFAAMEAEIGGMI